MDPEAQRIAIAEQCGWSKGMLELPDYLNDLNAIHEAEKTLNRKDTKQMAFFLFNLNYVILKHSGDATEFEAVHATAAQRAEAFLRTIGKWTT